MLKNRSLLIPLFLIALCISITACRDTGDSGNDKPQVFDSTPCTFKTYQGVLTVEEIKTDSLGNSENNVIVTFQFAPETKADTPPHVKKDGGNIKTTAQEVARIGAKPGKQYQTTAEYIESGGRCAAGPNIKDLKNWKPLAGDEKK